MGIFDKIFRRSKPAEDINKGYYTSANRTQYGTGIYGYNPGGISITELINSCRPGANIQPDPREWLTEARAIQWAIPAFAFAGKRHADFAGTPYIESKDEGLKTALQEQLDNIEIIPELDGISPMGKGGKFFASSLIVTSYLDGKAFYTIGLNDDERGQHVRMYDSFNFEYMEYIDHWGLRYCRDGYISLNVQENELLRSYTGSPVSWSPWGQQISYGTDLWAEAILKLMITQRDMRQRIANPPTNVFVRPTNETMNLARGPKADMIDKISDAVESLKTATKKSLKELRETGKASYHVSFMPGEIEIDQYTLGQDVRTVPGFMGEFDRLIAMLVLPTNMPPAYLGFQGPTVGMGSDLHRTQRQGMLAEIEKNQSRSGAEIGHTLNVQFMDNGNRNPAGKYAISWDMPNLEDQKLAAEVDKISADTQSQWVSTLADIQMLSSDPAQMRAFVDWVRENYGGSLDYLAGI